MDDQRFFQAPVQELNKAQQDIVRLEVEMVHMSRAIGQLSDTLKVQGQALAEIQRTLNEARGGWRTLMLVGGAASVVGGFISWVATHVRFTP